MIKLSLIAVLLATITPTLAMELQFDMDEDDSDNKLSCIDFKDLSSINASNLKSLLLEWHSKEISKPGYLDPITLMTNLEELSIKASYGSFNLQSLPPTFSDLQSRGRVNLCCSISHAAPVIELPNGIQNLKNLKKISIHGLIKDVSHLLLLKINSPITEIKVNIFHNERDMDEIFEDTFDKIQQTFNSKNVYQKTPLESYCQILNVSKEQFNIGIIKPLTDIKKLDNWIESSRKTFDGNYEEYAKTVLEKFRDYSEN